MAGGQSPERSRRGAAQPGVERSKSAKPTFAALCLCPSAATPTPHSVLLKTKAKVQFDRAVTGRSKPFFYRFCQSNRYHFPGLFTVVTLCRRIDRQWVAPLHQVPNTKNQVPAFWLIANCQLLFALFSKIFTHRPEALADFRRFLRANQVRKRTMT